MFKENLKDSITKVSFVFLGIIEGIFIYYVYNKYPNSRVGLFVVIIILLSAVVLFIERMKYKNKLTNEFNQIIFKLEKIIDGEYEPIESDNNKLFQLENSLKTIKNKYEYKMRIQDSIIWFVNALVTNIEMHKLIDVVLLKIVEETNSNWGVFYLCNANTEKLELKKSIGLSKKIYKEFDITVGEGFVGISAMKDDVKVYNEIPEDVVFENRTFLGNIKPKGIMILPIKEKSELVALIVLGSMYSYDEECIEVMRGIKNYLGIAVSNCLTYERSQRLTNELRFQNQLIQNMNDDLEKKVNERTTSLNNIINNINDYMIVTYDKDGYVIMWNHGAETLTGYKREEVIGKNVTVEGDKFSKEELLKQFSIASKEGEFLDSAWYQKKDGTKFLANIVVTPTFDKLGNIIGYTSIIKDITYTKHLEDVVIREKAYSVKLLENTSRAVVFSDKDGIIINFNKLAMDMLLPSGKTLIGHRVDEFFCESERISENLKRIAKSLGKGEFLGTLLVEHDGYHRICLDVISIDLVGKMGGTIIYLTKVKI